MLEWEEYFEPHILERGRSYARRGAVKYISRHEDTIEANMIVQEWLPHNAAAALALSCIAGINRNHNRGGCFCSNLHKQPSLFLRFWINYMRYKLTKYRRQCKIIDEMFFD